MQQIGNLNLRPWIWLAGITLLTTVCVWGLLAVAPWENMVPDFVCYWAAGELIASGHSPYDVGLQAEIQRRCGWDKARDGLGRYDFLPYYYPPWFAAGCALLLPLGYQGAKIAWFFINFELLLVTAYLLRDAVPGLPRSIPLVTVPIFVFSVISLVRRPDLDPDSFSGRVGMEADQIAAATCSRGRARLPDDQAPACGSACPVAAALVGAAAALGDRAGFCSGPGRARAGERPTRPVVADRDASGQSADAASHVLLPLDRHHVVSHPQDDRALRHGASGACTSAVAIPFLVLVTWDAFDRSRPLEDIIALGLIAPFIVAPYGRHYDFPVLLIPMYVLLARRLSEISGAILLVALVILPYIHFGVLVRFRQKYPSNVRLFPEFTFFWVPLLLTLIWLATEASAARHRNAVHGGFGLRSRVHRSRRSGT